MAKEMTAKERLKLPHQAMPEQDAHERTLNIREVPLGFTAEQAMAEAERCLQCLKPHCIKGCPVEIDIPAFLKLVAEGKFLDAIHKVKEKNILPAVCGRVCPQEEQCQAVCTVTKALKDIHRSVGIGRLERFVADWERENGSDVQPPSVAKTGKRVAVVGSGPAGLTVAGDLINCGHHVTIFEALHRPGGVLVYGIPEFRLPKAIVDWEVNNLQKLGVKIVTNAVIGKVKTIPELFEDGFNAVFVGTGAGLPVFKNIPGENAIGVYSANEYLTRANLMNAYGFPESSDTPVLRAKRVATFGGGNVAMDSARTALRLGAEESMIVYRRSEKEMPARHEEYEHAREEGIKFLLLTDATKILSDEKGRVSGIECIKMELGAPDESGRRKPVPVPNSNHVVPCELVIVALGNRPNPLIQKSHPELQINKWGNIVADKESAKTSMKGVWAGGDIVLGAATVILAMGEGRRAANSIHQYLSTGQW